MKDRIKPPKKLEPILAQEYYAGCDLKQMVGTKKHPVWLCGYSAETKDNIYTAFYYGDGKSPATSIWNTDLFRVRLGAERINLYLNGRYYVNIRLPVRYSPRIFLVDDKMFKTAEIWKLDDSE